MSTTPETLGPLRQKIQEASKHSLSLEPDELELLITGFLPTHTAGHRSEVYILLSAFCQAIRQLTNSTKAQQPDVATQSLTNIFAPLVISHLGDLEENSVAGGISFLTALFQVDREVASAIFLRDGVVDCIADSVDLFSSSQFALGVAHLLGQACGHKSCREAVATQVSQWLAAKSRQTSDVVLRAAAAIAVIKLERGQSSDAATLGGSNEGRFNSSDDQDLATLMKSIIIEDNKSALADAIEGLAYMSVDASLKEDLSRDPVFLSRLFSLVPSRSRTHHHLTKTPTDLAILYGIVVVISNICIYRPRLNEEAAQIEKLKRIVKAGKKSGQETQDPGLSPLNDDDHCKERARRLVASGVLDVLTSVVYATDSDGVRSTVGIVFLSIVEDKDNRGKVLQSGGTKALTTIIQRSLPQPDSTTPARSSALDAGTFSAIQALAKLAITSSPVQVFGPNEGAMYDAVRPLTLLLLHSSSTLLQRFESMMALTNLSSQSPELASRVARTENLMDRVELFLLEDHVLIRRAAMELVCNLIAGSDEVFEKYSGAAGTSESKIQIVLALSDVDDLQTRLAASGALATLTTAPTACQVLIEFQRERGRVLPILTRLIDPSSLSPLEPDCGDMGDESDPGLIHRGVICTRNFLLNSVLDVEWKKRICAEAGKVGLTKALEKVIQNPSVHDVVAQPAVAALKWLAESK